MNELNKRFDIKPTTKPEQVDNTEEERKLHEARREKVALARDPKTKPKALAVLAKSEDWIIRANVAVNLNTPIPVLDQLLDDDTKAVRDEAKRTKEKIANAHYYSEEM
jgi:2-succinyl-5-enolpyruvyl-6-hydroxy-3-cyclohexene-1-carboxylate synthase